jgi:hypothetical protein
LETGVGILLILFELDESAFGALLSRRDTEEVGQTFSLPAASVRQCDRSDIKQSF